MRAIADGAERPTHIMYRANLSWVMLQVYLRALIKRGLIVTKQTGGRRRYELTDEGYRIISHFHRVTEALNSQRIIA